jgi:uncharacterized protein YgfB (UPF0149 family)
MFNAIQQLLTQGGSELSASEVHGLFCALHCLRAPQNTSVWQTDVLPEFNADNGQQLKTRQALSQLHCYVLDQLQSPDCDMSLLLPADDQPLNGRIQALSAWADGFLLGLGLAGLKQHRHLPKIAQEFLQDLTTLARGVSVEQASEQDYMQVLEYVRMGLLNFFVEQA